MFANLIGDFRLVCIRRGKTFIIEPIHVIDFVRRLPGLLENRSVKLISILPGRRTSLLFLGSPQSREVDDRRNEKLDIALPPRRR
jgi:hypothetical protein